MFSKQRVADYGCGPGLLLHSFDKHATDCQFFGYDFSEAGLSVAKAKVPKATFEQRDLYQNYPDSFGLILCTEVFEHLEYPERALKSLLAQLSSPGYLLLTVPNGRLDTFEGHINFWSLESWTIFISTHAPGYSTHLGMMRGYDSKGFLYALLTKA